MGNSLDEFPRIQIICLHQNNVGYKKIAADTRIPTSTVQSVIKRWQRTGDWRSGRSTGRPPVLTKHDKRRLYQDVSDNPFKELRELASDSCLPVSARTIDR